MSSQNGSGCVFCTNKDDGGSIQGEKDNPRLVSILESECIFFLIGQELLNPYFKWAQGNI